MFSIEGLLGFNKKKKQKSSKDQDKFIKPNQYEEVFLSGSDQLSSNISPINSQKTNSTQSLNSTASNDHETKYDSKSEFYQSIDESTSNFFPNFKEANLIHEKIPQLDFSDISEQLAPQFHVTSFIPATQFLKIAVESNLHVNDSECIHTQDEIERLIDESIETISSICKSVEQLQKEILECHKQVQQTCLKLNDLANSPDSIQSKTVSLLYTVYHFITSSCIGMMKKLFGN
jgi:hypothetical protein